MEYKTTRYPGGLAVGSMQRTDGTKGFTLANVFAANLGAPAALDADGLIKAATGTEIPDAAETVTYTTSDLGTSPCDGASSTWILDVPRNVTAAVSHASAVVAMTITVTGADVYGTAMSEALTIAATGTSQTAAGKKAFKTITSIALTAAADASANTVNIGWGDVLGLPLPMAENTILKEIKDGAVATAGAAVVADTTSPATTTTGDPRGTYDPNAACNGTAEFKVIYIPSSLTSNTGIA